MVNVNNTLTPALENYDGVVASKHTTRRLVNGISQLYRMLFGTAMHEDVKKLRDRFNYLAFVASAQSKAITLNCKQSAMLHQQMHDSQLHVLTASLNIWMKHKVCVFSVRLQLDFVSLRVYCKLSAAY